jgi:hypothetical protein
MDPDDELLIRGSEFIRSGESWPYLDKLLLTHDADRIHLEITFPWNEEEGSSTSLFLMDDGALGYATWHEACTYLRPDDSCRSRPVGRPRQDIPTGPNGFHRSMNRTEAETLAPDWAMPEAEVAPPNRSAPLSPRRRHEFAFAARLPVRVPLVWTAG